MSWWQRWYSSGVWFWWGRLKWYVKLTKAERYMIGTRLSERRRKQLACAPKKDFW